MFFFSGFILDPDRVELRGPDGAAVRLRPKAFEVLRLLVANSHRVLGKQELLDAAWPGVHVGEDSLFHCIREIRTALDDHERQMVKLVSGRGYLFAVDVSAGRDATSAGTTPPSAPQLRPKRIPAPRFLVALAVIAVAAPLTFVVSNSASFSRPSKPAVEVLPLIDSAANAQDAALSRGIAIQLLGGLSKIDGIHLVVSREQDGPVSQQSTAEEKPATLLVQGELRKTAQSWIFQVRLIDAATREIRSVTEVAVDAKEPDAQRAQARLAAGAGYALASHLNALEDAGNTAENSPSDIAIQQAVASINQTTRERFATARTILEKYLADEPANVDLQVALATLHLRGIQMMWYGPAEENAAENNARALLEEAVRARPQSATVMAASCRFLTATNQFAESLVACARALALNPWDGGALYQLGLTQLQLGRFDDALATFVQADSFDTPKVSRWTWLLGAGLAHLVLDRNEEAADWLRRSIAITPASGRSHMLLAAAYQRLGRQQEAKDALRKGMELRPGSTARNVGLPSRNASEAYLQAASRIGRTLAEIGLPEGNTIDGK
ncbi:MAG: winged helix-turn-helix domain-containing protein [Shinella sp.]|uniref:winged helix-turn-helix domain-containing protein n=1 Tax=Shinella sp. TaxID=1870904 RepID=UPI0040359431